MITLGDPQLLVRHMGEIKNDVDEASEIEMISSPDDTIGVGRCYNKSNAL